METTTRVHSPVSCGQGRPPMRTERYVPPNMEENEALEHGANVCFLCLNAQKRLGCSSGFDQNEDPGSKQEPCSGAVFYGLSSASFVGADVSVPLDGGVSDTPALFHSRHISFTAAQLQSPAAFPAPFIRCSLRRRISSRLSARSSADGVLLLYGNCCKTRPDGSGWGDQGRGPGFLVSMGQSHEIFQRPQKS